MRRGLKSDFALAIFSSRHNGFRAFPDEEGTEINPSASGPQDCGRSRGCDPPPGVYTRRRPNLSPALEQAAMAE